MSEACLKQIRYWSDAIQQMLKAIRRKNTHIKRLQYENNELHQKVAKLHVELAEVTLKEQTNER